MLCTFITINNFADVMYNRKYMKEIIWYGQHNDNSKV